MLEVKRLRQEREWNQTELAYHAGLAPSVISQIENGKRDPSARTLRKLSKALGVEVGELFPKGQAQLPLEPEAAGLANAGPSANKLANATALEDLARLWAEQLEQGFYDRRTLGLMHMAGFSLAMTHEAAARKHRDTLPPRFRAQLEAAEEQFADVAAQIMDAQKALEESGHGPHAPPDELAAKREARDELLRRLRGNGQAQHA